MIPSVAKPPEKYHVFISYTSHECEIKELKPHVDAFLNAYLRPMIETTIGEPPLFYDGYSLWEPIRRKRSDEEIRAALEVGICESEIPHGLLVAQILQVQVVPV